MKTERKKVLDRIDYFDIYQLNNETFGEIETVLSLLKVKYEGVEHLFQAESYGYDGGLEFYVRVFRLETDREYKSRV